MLVLVRHAESTANAENRKAGQLNVPLTALGIEQAKELHSSLGGYKFDAVFLSDAERAQDTTWHAIGTQHPRETWTLVEELRERSGGLLEGMTYPEIRKQFPPKKYKLWQRDFFEAPPQGESMQEVQDRVIPYCKEYVFPLVNAGQNVYICTHNIPMKIIIGHIKGLDEIQIPKLHIDNAMPYFLYGNVRV